VELLPTPAEMAKILEEYPDVNRVRFEVVPRVVSEENFWTNMLWKCHAFRRCNSVEMALKAASALMPERRAMAGGTRRKNYGLPNVENELQQLRDRVGACTLKAQWLDSKRRAARSEVQASLGSFQLLSNLISKREVSELADSVCESCKYRKAKTASLLGELNSSPKEVEGTDLAVDQGELYIDLLRTNEELHRVLEQYERMSKEGASSPTLLARSMSRESSDVVIVSPTGTKNVQDHPADAAERPDNAFTAELPWDEEEE
jgi:hypothetical protein